MFDWQPTKYQDLKKFDFDLSDFDGVCPTFNQSPHSFIAIGVEQYSNEVYQKTLNCLLGL